MGRALLLATLFATQVQADDIFAGRNVNVIGPPPAGSGEYADAGLRQQNEPSCAVNPENPLRMCCGFNDYRGIDIPELGDAWEGIACTIDGGESWNSQLIPGHRADLVHSLGLEFAADPNLVSVPGGLVFNYIAANRDQVGGLYVQLYAWRNKEDGWPVEPVGGPRLVSKGTSGRFIDKPHAFGFLHESGETVSWNWTNASGPQSRELPAGTLAISAAIFTGNDNNDRTMINFWTSDDWGLTWNQPTKLTESKGINSGINLAANGDTVCAVWRRFDDTNESNAILQACSGDRGDQFAKPKKISDICPFDLTTLNGEAPAEGVVSLRSNAFPVIAADGSKFYTFWTDRGFAQASNGQSGCELTVPALDPETGEPLLDENGEPELAFNPSFARIVYSTSGNGGNGWSQPQAVEDVAGADPSCSVDNPAGFPGHQFMPAALGAGQEVVLAWYDTRCDQVNQYRGAVDPEVDKQLILDLWQDGVGLWRHTADIRAIRLVDGTPATPGSTQISRYPRALLPGHGLVQGQYEFVNARLFLQGTAPFLGDYITLAAPAYLLDPASGNWRNSNSLDLPGSPTFRVGFTSNRDLFGNLWGAQPFGGSSSPYNPKNGATANGATQTMQQTDNSSVGVQDPPSGPLACTPTDDPEINPSNDRTRDQNVYSAAIFPEFTMESPGAIKLSGAGIGGGAPLQRAIPVVVTNHGSSSASLTLRIIDQPAGGIATFSQFDEVGDTPATTVTVKTWPGSAAVRTVFVTSPDGAASTTLRVNTCPAGSACNDQDALAQVVLNEAPLALEQPDFGKSSVLAQETHDPTILNPALLNEQLIRLLLAEAQQDPFATGPLMQALIATGYLAADFQLADVFNSALIDPDLLAILLQNPDLLDANLIDAALLSQLLAYPELINSRLLYPDALEPNLFDPELLNPDLLNAELWALVAQNPDLLNPDVLNPDVLNALVANPNVLNPDLLNLIIANPDVLNPDVLNLLVANQTIFATAVSALDGSSGSPLTDPASWAELLNILVSNPNILNPDLLNSAVTDGLLAVSEDPGFPGGGDEATQLAYIQANYGANADLVNAVIANPDLLNPNILNPDILNPDVLNPNILNPDILNPDILNPDILNPDVLNPNVLNPNILNPDVLNPDLLNPDVLNPDLLNLLVMNPNILNPDVLNPDVLNPDLLNPDLLNPDLLNALVENPNLLNPNVLNPNVLNPNVLNPNLLNATLDDYGSLENPGTAVPDEVDTGGGAYINLTWQVQNTGNTTTGYMAQTTVADAAEDPDITGGQIIVSKPYLRQTTVNCEQVVETTNNVVVNVPAAIENDIVENPDPTEPGTEPFASFWLAPGEIANVTVRVFGTSAEALANARIVGRTGLYISSEACTSGVSAANCASRLPFALIEKDVDPPEFGELETFYEQFAEPFEALAPEGVSIDYVLPPALDEGDGGAVAVSCDFAPGDTFPLGISHHSCTATDSSGNAETIPFTVTVLDTTAPTLAITQDGTGLPVAVEQTSADGAQYDFADFAGWSLAASDNVDAEPEVACSVINNASGEELSLAIVDGAISDSLLLSPGTWDLVCVASDSGPAQVTASQTDEFGNEVPTAVGGVNTSEPQLVGSIVVVADSTPPVVTVPADIAGVEATSGAGAAVSFTAPGAEDLGQALPTSCDAVSGDLFPLGTTVVTCSATDASGLVGSASFSITVADTIAPVISAPAVVSEEALGADGAPATVSCSASDYGAGAAQIVDPNPVISLGGILAVYPIGNTTVTCTATDASGNTAAQQILVSIVDTTAPVINVPADITGVEATSAAGAAVAFDPAPSATDLGAALPVSCAPASGDTFPLGTTAVICSATDASGNTITAGFDVTVVDTTAPVVTVPGDITVATTSANGASVNFAPAPSASDLGGELPVVCSAGNQPVSSGDTFPIGTTTVTCEATDGSGNTGSASFNVTVNADIVWINPPLQDGVIHEDNIGPNLSLSWGYGAPGELLNSRDFIDQPGGKGTAPLSMDYLGADCAGGELITVDLDAGNSSLRYQQGEWLLNWQTGQSQLDTDGDGTGDTDLAPGCYELQIPRVSGVLDTRLFILN
jgi:hypothetical protein